MPGLFRCRRNVAICTPRRGRAKRLGITQVSGLMSDKFADLEESRSRSKFVLVLGVVLLGIFVVYRWSTTDWQPLHGQVESVDAASVGNAPGHTVETASVRLSDGSLVEAEVISGGPLSVGDQVRLVVKPTSAIGTPYEVVAKVPGTEP